MQISTVNNLNFGGRGCGRSKRGIVVKHDKLKEQVKKWNDIYSETNIPKTAGESLPVGNTQIVNAKKIGTTGFEPAASTTPR